jgi:hypothetical protein
MRQNTVRSRQSPLHSLLPCPLHTSPPASPCGASAGFRLPARAQAVKQTATWRVREREIQRARSLCHTLCYVICTHTQTHTHTRTHTHTYTGTHTHIYTHTPHSRAPKTTPTWLLTLQHDDDSARCHLLSCSCS